MMNTGTGQKITACKIFANHQSTVDSSAIVTTPADT